MEHPEYPKMIYPGEVDPAAGVVVNCEEEEAAQRKAWKKAPATDGGTGSAGGEQ